MASPSLGNNHHYNYASGMASLVVPSVVMRPLLQDGSLILSSKRVDRPTILHP